MRPSDFRKLPPQRSGGWIRTYTGAAFWPLDPRPEDIYIEDVAHALALVNRFNGHTPVPYSVGQHSVLVSRYLGKGIFGFEGLLHDASEAYINDLVSPAKRGMPGYRRVEKRIMDAIRVRFGMLKSEPHDVKIVDTRVYLAEVRDVMKRELGSIDAEMATKQIIKPWSWQKTEREFLKRFYALDAMRREAML